MPGSRGIPLGAGLQIFPASQAQRRIKKKAKAQRELLPLLTEILDDLSGRVEAVEQNGNGDAPALRGKSKLASKVSRMKELAEVIKS